MLGYVFCSMFSLDVTLIKFVRNGNSYTRSIQKFCEWDFPVICQSCAGIQTDRLEMGDSESGEGTRHCL